MIRDWTTKFLEEIAEIGDGNHSGNYPKASEMVQEGIPFIRGTNLINGKVSPEDMRFISPEKHEILKKGHLKTGDILFTNRGQVGKKAIVDKRFNGSNLNSQVAWFRCNEQIYNRYLFYFLDSPSILKFITSNTNGAALQQLTIRQIRKLQIVFPPLPEQQHIVAILDDAFEAIDQAKANIEKNIENAKELFQSKLNDIFSQKGEGWEEKTLGEVCMKTKNIRWQDHKNEEYQYVDLSSVSRETLEVTETAIVNDKNAPSRAKKIIEKGDVIFATTRPTLKRATIIDEELDGQICSTGYVVLRPNEKISTDWIFFYLLTSTFMDRMESLQRGASYPAVTDSDVKGSILSIPTSKITEGKYISVMHQLREGTNELIIQYQEKLNSLEELKKSILQKAFAGELTNKTVEV